MFFNRKFTAFQQALDKLKSRLDEQEGRIEKELTDNKRNLLEFADLSNKTRRLYLRLTRLTKIEQKESSDKEPPNGVDPSTDARDIRDSIESRMEF